MSGKFIAPDNGVKQVSIEGARTGIQETISRDKKGFFVAGSSRQAAALRAEGFIEASLNGVAAANSGYLCVECGFGSWFKKCGRCGAECKKAGE